MRLRIVSDGTPAKTFVTDEKGNRVENVSAIRWHISADHGAVASIDVLGVECEVTAELVDAPKPDTVEVICPACLTRIFMAASEVKDEDRKRTSKSRWQCGHCGIWNLAYRWFDLSRVV